ncbi:MAG TPA: glycosyltransferase family 2 protein [Vicinamibacterales bacterium]|nr:glycosyltransferase family 2 protein [Vicinamibacterales bacterium]
MTPRVSIAIRAYRRRWLHDAVASVLSQTHRDLELIVYDDAGDLADVAGAPGDPRVRYERATPGLQASGRFLAAVALCRGGFIGLLDDDDRYEPTFVERLLRALDENPAAGIAFCRTTFEAGGRLTRPIDRRRAGRMDDAARRMLSERWTVSPSHMLIRRPALEAAWRDQPMPDGVAPDVFVNLGVALAGWSHVLVDEPLVIYRWHDDQLSRRGPAATDTPIATWQQLRLDDPDLSRLRHRLLARAYIARAVARLAAGDRRGSRADLAAAAAVAPAAWPLPRQLLALASRGGPTGSWLMRGWLSLWAGGHQRRRPPTRIGGARYSRSG